MIRKSNDATVRGKTVDTKFALSTDYWDIKRDY